MAVTLSDYIEPEVFNSYVIKRTNELSALYQSGIISHNAELDALASGGGRTINMPFWSDLTGDDAVMTYEGDVTTTTIQAGQDVAVLLQRVKAWKAPDMQYILAGSDPARAIGDLVASFWARMYQKILINELEGVFASTDMAGNVYEYTTFDSTNAAQEILKALYKLGDAHARLTAVACNSADALQIDLQSIASNNAQYITNYTEADRTTGRRIIVDDGIPQGTIYIFGEGAIGLGNGFVPNPVATPRDELKGAGIEYLVNRKSFVLHPRGVAWTGTSMAGLSPTNAELATGTNWNRVYEPKDIRIVKMKAATPSGGGGGGQGQ